MADASPTPNVLFICMANLSRSPMAEGLLRRRAAERGITIEVGSAGFMFDGKPPSEHAATVMEEVGIDISEHRSRIVSPDLVLGSTLILTMERTHARTLAVDVPEAKDRIHTLGAASRELHRMIGPSFEQRVTQLGGKRLAADLLGRGPDELADPYGGSRRLYRRTLARLDDLMVGILDALAPG